MVHAAVTLVLTSGMLAPILSTIMLHSTWPYITMNSGLLTTRCLISAAIVATLAAGTVVAALQLVACPSTTWTAIFILAAATWQALHRPLVSALLVHSEAAWQTMMHVSHAHHMASARHDRLQSAYPVRTHPFQGPFY